jgi:urea transport system ATP-binding protein
MGQDITRIPVFERARMGLGYVPQGRLLFSQLTVEENLMTALQTGRLKKIPDLVYELFPVLSEMKNRKAGNLSGGQQQMVAIGRALTAGPVLLILDEPTEGIQPSIIKEIAAALVKLQQATDCTVLLSEQVLSFAASVADRLVVLERGAVVHSCGKGAEDVDAVKAFLTI